MSVSVEQAQGRSQYPGFRGTIKAVGTGRRGSRSLAFEEAREAMRALLDGQTTDAQAGAFLIAMRIKGEEPEELAGLVQALRDAAVSREPGSVSPVATAGAYDGVAESPQLSLAAAVVSAACGAPCVLHCGDSLGPKYGTNPADVLAALGGPRRPGLDASRAMLEASGISLVHAGEAIPGWDRLAAIRNQVGLRGPVHSAEKLVDHLGADSFVVGYTHQPYGPRLVEALSVLGAQPSLAVRGVEGSDIPRPARPQATGVNGTPELPQQLGLQLPEDSASPEASAALTRAILGGTEAGPAERAVALGAVLRLWAAGHCDSVDDGLAQTRRAISSGAAAASLERMLESCG
jgi:anthranilate phosphoribosyltransferase